VLERHRTIRQYLQSKATSTNPEDSNINEAGISREVMDAYVKSCGKKDSFS
jgi:hypothetical protein